ncbi:hypothetical protein [Ralstonia pseudosolanacearum]|uniref:hypothetical protein n=1 Tax=Ralstonia pseudosolanacearum TaxID=1310165 RepID=UPI0007D7E848|nr:hypothetical protein [Ralstonia pseudosolanacearum]OAI69052.1 hypothetical protein RSP781_07990 [Ralstonia pseudosolanacearum]
MHISIEELRALSQAAKNSISDPDATEYPDLFLTQTFSDEEMGDYDGNPIYPVDGPWVCEEKMDYSNFGQYSRHQRAQTKLKVFSEVQKTIPNSLLKEAGWKRPKNAPTITYLEPDKWLDPDTGEILTNAQARKQGAINTAPVLLRKIEIQAFLRQCPPSKLDFIAYILRIRSKRGGLIVDLKTAIDRWIDYKHPKMHSTDRARRRKSYEKFLYDLEILADPQTLKKEFQVMGYSTKTDYLGEASKFSYVLPIPAKPGCGFLSDPATGRKKLLEWIESKRADVPSATA